MRPHDLDPFLVVNSTVAPKHEQFRGTWWDGLTIGDLLAEAPPRSPPWTSLVASRIAVMSTGPVLRAARETGPLTRRLELAGLLNLADDADPTAARESAWPALRVARDAAAGAGSLAPKLVLVGDRDPYDRVPFFAKSGMWLFRALRELGWDELTVYVCNAFTMQRRALSTELGALHEVFGRYEPTWVGLGDAAQEILRGTGIPHVEVVHPSHARRFQFADGPIGYARRMLDAGLTLGPWHAPSFPGGEGLPVLPTADPCVALPTRLGFPLSVSLRTNSLREADGSRPRTRTTDPRSAVARTLYVTGECRTPKEAAEKVGMNPALVKRQARDENWEAERIAYVTDVRERAKEAGAESEAKSIATARKLSWNVALKAIQSLDRQLNEPDYRPRAQEVKALVDAAVTLKGLGDPAQDAERARLAGLRPQDLVEELKATMSGIFGDEKEGKS